METLVVDEFHIGAAVESLPENTGLAGIDIDEDPIKKIGYENKEEQKKKDRENRKAVPEGSPVSLEIVEDTACAFLFRCCCHMYSKFLE
jgi:hypothetical protein